MKCSDMLCLRGLCRGKAGLLFVFLEEKSFFEGYDNFPALLILLLNSALLMVQCSRGREVLAQDRNQFLECLFIRPQTFEKRRHPK